MVTWSAPSKFPRDGADPLEIGYRASGYGPCAIHRIHATGTLLTFRELSATFTFHNNTIFYNNPPMNTGDRLVRNGQTGVLEELGFQFLLSQARTVYQAHHVPWENWKQDVQKLALPGWYKRGSFEGPRFPQDDVSMNSSLVKVSPRRSPLFLVSLYI